MDEPITNDIIRDPKMYQLICRAKRPGRGDAEIKEHKIICGLLVMTFFDEYKDRDVMEIIYKNDIAGFVAGDIEI